MRNIKHLMLAAVLFSGMTVYGANAGTFHIRPDGNDSAAGTESAPWKTPSVAMEKAARAARDGSARLVFHGGVYPVNELIRLANFRGSLTVCAAKGETPVLDGSVLLRGWRKEGNIWKVHIDCDPGVAVSERGRFDLYCNGELQTLARWPDTGFEHTGRALGKTPLPKDWSGYEGTKEGVYSFKGTPSSARLKLWSREPDLWALGYWYWDWYESYQKVKSIDSAGNRLEFHGPESTYGYRKDARFYVLNALCELDAEKEFYLDRRDNTLYWFPPKGINPETADVRASVYSGDYMIQLDACVGVTIEGLSMRGGRNGAVLFNQGAGNVLKDCNIEMFGSDAINITGKNQLVSGCRLRELGCGGIIIAGGDRKTLEPSGHRITGTTVDNFSLFKHTYKPAVLFRGAGFRVDHCLFRGSSSSALNYCGNDIIIEYNIFTDLVRESDDQGGTDSWYDIAERGVVIRYNYWKDIIGGVRVGAAAIRLDDIISGHSIYGNVFENCGGKGFGGVQIHGGRDNHVFGNVFYGCQYAVTCGQWPVKYWEDKYEGQKEIIERYNVFGPLYTSKYPEIKNIPDGRHNHNFFYGNLAVDVPTFCNKPDQNEVHDNTVISSDGHDVRYFTTRRVLKKYGLKAIPFNEIGPGK